jgi:hypothetical protein
MQHQIDNTIIIFLIDEFNDLYNFENYKINSRVVLEQVNNIQMLNNKEQLQRYINFIFQVKIEINHLRNSNNYNIMFINNTV